MRHSKSGRCFGQEAPTDLYDYAHPRATKPRGLPESDLGDWQVTDGWPAQIPVTQAEIDLFEAWFGGLFDELFATPSKEP